MGEQSVKMKNIVLPDYQNSGLNVAASILCHFGAPCTQKPHPTVDVLLAKKQYKNIVVMLFDGLGLAALRDHLPKNTFLRTHTAKVMTAVFPATTVSATTSIESGYAPVEHSWLGWSQYFAPIDRTVDVFTNRDSVTGERIAGEKTVARTLIPYRSICDRLHDTGKVRAHIVSPHGIDPVKTLDELFAKARELCLAPGRRYIYTYWNEPDHTMHDEGVMGAGDIVRDIDARVQAFCAALNDDTLVLITADHGLMDCEQVCVAHHPEIIDMCLRPASIEARAAAFFIRAECMEAFPAVFEKAFGTEHFWLIKSEEAVQRGLFGPGAEHPMLRSFLGDYLAIATGKYSIGWEYDPHPLIGMHAGLTENEMYVPLIVGKE